MKNQRKMFNKKVTPLLFLFLLINNFAIAQSGDQERPTVQAISIESDPVIDGNILNEAFWKKINPISKLVQQQPNNGHTPSEKTIIRIAYTSKILHVGVVCYDSTPNKSVVNDARRSFIVKYSRVFDVFK